jgi:hypothetical protein
MWAANIVGPELKAIVPGPHCSYPTQMLIFGLRKVDVQSENLEVTQNVSFLL